MSGSLTINGGFLNLGNADHAGFHIYVGSTATPDYDFGIVPQSHTGYITLRSRTMDIDITPKDGGKILLNGQVCINGDCRSSWPSGGVGDDVLQSFPKICYATDLDTGKVYVNLPGCAESYPLSNNLLYNAQVTAKTSWWGGFSADMGCTGHVNQPKRVVDASLSTCWSVGYGYYYDPDRSGEVLKVDAGSVITAQLDVKFAVKSGVCSTSKWCYGHVEISSDGSHWYRLATLGSNNCKYEVGKYNFGSRTFRYVRFVAGSGYSCEMQIYEVLAWG